MLLFSGCHLVCQCFLLFIVHVCLQVCVLTQSCLTLCDSVDYNSPGASVHGILQERILERVPFPSPGDLPTQGSNLASSLPLSYQGSPATLYIVGRILTRSLKEFLTLLNQVLLRKDFAGGSKVMPFTVPNLHHIYHMSVIMLMLS